MGTYFERRWGADIVDSTSVGVVLGGELELS